MNAPSLALNRLDLIAKQVAVNRRHQPVLAPGRVNLYTVHANIVALCLLPQLID